MTASRELRLTGWVLATAVIVSVVHYTDNTVRYDEYTQGVHTVISQPLIPISWVVLTAAGIAGYRCLRRGSRQPAASLLALYSVSGLIGPLHYTAAPPDAFDWLQNTFIASDTLLGVALLVIAIRIATTTLADRAGTTARAT